MGTATKQANFLLPEDLLEELKKTVSKREQSKVVTEALRKELKRLKLKKALESSFGSWDDRQHPELKAGTGKYIRAKKVNTYKPLSMKTVIVDTDILIDFLRGRENARKFLLSLVKEATICCSVITVAEISAGMKDHERDNTMELLDSMHIININRTIAEKAGEYKRSEKKQKLELDDCFIAATAFEQKAVLATGNGKHYPMTDIEKMTLSSK